MITEKTETLYIPKGAISLASLAGTKQQQRVGIQGLPNTGKTWSSLTWPSPVVINLDKGLGAHIGRPDVLEIPLWQFHKFEIKDKLIEWLLSEGLKLTTEQTLVVDALSSLDAAYHIWFKHNEDLFRTKSGKIDEFAEWNVKKKYFSELHETFKELKCNVIMLCHESERADKPMSVGAIPTYSGKIRPLLNGAYGDIIEKDYTDWFRQLRSPKPRDFSSIDDDKLKSWGVSSVLDLKKLFDSQEGDNLYYWQTSGDDVFNGKTSSLVGAPKFILANHENYCRYMRKVSIGV